MLQLDRSLTTKYRKCTCTSGILLLAICLFVLITAVPFVASAQDEPQYDEISVFLNIQKVGGVDIPAVILDETVYLPVIDIFAFLKIKNNPSAQRDSVSGFFINQQATYLIDRINNRITFQGKVFSLKKTDFIKTETNLYLRSPFLGEIFGLDCTFNFRSLSVMLNTKLELPIIREMRQEQMRSNISRLKGEVKADTTIGRKFPAFHFGMADWSVISTQQLNGQVDARLNLSLGTVIAGGEANALLNYSNNAPFSEKQQQYLWRFVNNDRPALRQVMAGKIYTQVTSSIYDPIVGVQFTNTPTTYRRSFGTYTISDITEPNWTVELYVNNVLVDYMKADASGFYKFEVPLVYGNSAVKLKFYGPWGEERTKEENISIPFNFLPPKELEYSVSAGMVEDTLNSRFSRATLNYGLSRRITIGGGVEYLSSVVTGNTMPFFNASLRLMSGLLFTGEYTYAVRAKGMLSYRLPSNLQFELNYTKYEKGQKAIIYNYLEERKATVSIPIKRKNFSAYTRLTVNQIVLPNLKNTNAEMLWSGSVYGVSTNFTTYGLFTDLTSPYLYSNLSLAFRLPKRITLTPQAQYEYNSNQLISARVNFEKPILKNGFLNLSYEQNFRSNTKSIEVGFRYDLNFAQTGLSVRNTNDQTTLVETARGSLLYDAKTHYLGANNRTSVGKGGITLLPYVDVNGNGRRDKGEPKAAGLQFRINGGSIVRNDKDTTIRILDLTPYTSYLLELDKNSFDQISWQMHNLTMSVMIDPNQFKTIEIPIAVMGEASGTVYNGSKGQGRILVCFYRNDSTLAGRTLTETDGYYSYLGLKPGKYTVRIDPEQLKKIKMISTPETHPLEIHYSAEGDIIEGLDFKLSLNKALVPDSANIVSPAEPATTQPIIPVNPVAPVQPSSEAKSAVGAQPSGVKPAVTENLPKISEDARTLPNSQSTNQVDQLPAGEKGEVFQIGAFKVISNAEATCKKLKEWTDKPSVMIFDGEYYHVWISGLSGKKEADQLFDRLTKSENRHISHPVKDLTQSDSLWINNKKFRSAIQVGAFVRPRYAIRCKKKLIGTVNLPVVIIYEDGYFKVQIVGFRNRNQANELLPGLIEKGFIESYLLRLGIS